MSYLNFHFFLHKRAYMLPLLVISFICICSLGNEHRIAAEDSQLEPGNDGSGRSA